MKLRVAFLCLILSVLGVILFSPSVKASDDPITTITTTLVEGEESTTAIVEEEPEIIANIGAFFKELTFDKAIVLFNWLYTICLSIVALKQRTEVAITKYKAKLDKAKISLYKETLMATLSNSMTIMQTLNMIVQESKMTTDTKSAVSQLIGAESTSTQKIYDLIITNKDEIIEDVGAIKGNVLDIVNIAKDGINAFKTGSYSSLAAKYSSATGPQVEKPEV